ncbi:MAG: hypothetical protein ACFB14_15760 [Leptolyngbyaceae cyanobacterium]
MARQLGHGVPLGAFRNLGSWVQRRSLGTSSLSILDLKTFYPRGFPTVESSANEPQASTSAAVARKIDIPAPALGTQIPSDKRTSDLTLDTQVSGDKRTPDPASAPQILNNKRTSGPVSEKQTAPFRASLQRYFKPETSTLPATAADKNLSQQGVAHSPALANQVTAQSDLANPSTPDLQSASDPASTAEPAENISSTELSFPNVTERSKTSGDSALQRSATEEIQTDESGSSQPSVADITHSIQSLQPSSSTPGAIHSELQRTTDIVNSPSVSSSIRSSSVEPNTSIPTQQPAQRPGLASTDINQSIQSLREPSASLQRATEQHNQGQPSELRIQPGLESQAPSTTSPQLDPQTAQQPKTATPSIQRLNESTETPPSSLSPNQNPGTASIHDQGQLLQRQSDSTTAAIPTRQAEPESGPVQRATEQNPPTLKQPPGSGNDGLLNTHARNHSASNQTTTASNQLNVSPKIQTALESSQIPSGPTSSNSNTVQRQLASEESVNIDHSPPANPSPLVDNLPQVQPSSSQQRTSQPAGTDLIETISNAPIVTNSAESIQRVAESAQSPTSDSPNLSSVSTQNLDSIQSVSEVTVQPAVNLPQAAASPQLVSESSSAIQRTPDQSNITSEQVANDGNDNPIQSVTHQEIQSVANSSAPFSDQIAPSADIQRASETTSTPAQSKPTSDNLAPLQQQPNIVAEGSTNPGSSLSVDSRLELSQPNATAPTLDSGNGSSDTTDPPDVSSKPTASAQRSTAELKKDNQSSAEQPISQEQADQNEIAPRPSSHTEIQRSPNLSDTATSSTTDGPPSDPKFITSNVQSVANPVESIQRTADSTQSPKLAADETIQTDITQLAADNLSASSNIDNPSDSQPVTLSAESVQRIAELHQSTPSALNPNQIKETQQPAATSNANEEGNLSAGFFQTLPIQRLPDKADNTLSPSESSSAEQTSIVQRETAPDNTHSGSLSENKSLSEPQPLSAAGSESPAIPQEHRSDSPITPHSIQRLSDSTALSPPAPETTPIHNASPQPLTVSAQPKTAPDVSPVKPDNSQTSAGGPSVSAPSSSSAGTELQRASSVPATSSIADPSPPNTLQRQTDSLQSADISPAQTESTVHVFHNQGVIEPSDVTPHLTRDVPEISASSSQSESLQRQTDLPTSKPVPQISASLEIQQAPDAIDTPLSSDVQRSLSATDAIAESDQPTSETLTTQKVADLSKNTSTTPAESQSTSESQPGSPDIEVPSTTSSTASIQHITVESRQNELSNSNLSESRQSQSTSSNSSDIQRAVSSDSQSYKSELSDVLTTSSERTQPRDARRVQSSDPSDFSEKSIPLLQRSSNTTSDPSDATIHLPEPATKNSSDSAITAQRLSDDTIDSPNSSIQSPKTRQQKLSFSPEGSVTSDPGVTNQQVSDPVVQRSGDGETHRSQHSRIQETVNQDSVFEKPLKPLTTPTETHSADIPETSASSSQSESLQRQTDLSTSKPASQPITPPEIQQAPDTADILLSSDVQHSLSASDSVTESDQPTSETLTTQKAADLNKDTPTTPDKNQSTLESQSWSPNIKAPSTDPSITSIQRGAIESPQTDTIQPKETQSFELQPGQTALEYIQQISDVRKTDFSKLPVESSQIDKNELSDSHISESKQRQLTSLQPSNIQRAVSSDSRSYQDERNDALTSSPDLTQPPETRRVQPSDSDDEVSADRSGPLLQRSSNITSDPIETTIRLSGSEISADTAATQRLSDNVSGTIDSTKTPSDSSVKPSKTLQQEQGISSRESATSDPGITNQEVSDRVVQRTPNTPVANSYLSLDESLSNKAQHSHTGTHSLPATDSLQPDAVSVQRSPQDSSRQEASSYPAPQSQSSGDGETHHSQPLGTQEAANQSSVFEKSLKPLTAPTEIYPAPVSEPAPAPNPEFSPYVTSPSTSIQRDSLAVRQLQSSGSEISLQRSSNEDIPAGKSLSHKALGSSSINRPRVLQPLGVLKPLPSLQTAKSVPTPSVANTHSSIQRRSDSDNIPSEWSNLEDLVTHLQSTPPDHVSAKAAPTQQPSNSKKPTAKVTPQPEPQTVKLPKPATVTVQRQITSQPSTTKPTVIQACKDTSADADSTNADDQTDDDPNYSQYLELLAQEVYGLLRQRLSLEQERRGPKYPR